MVVMVQPFVQVFLERLDRRVEPPTERRPEELIQDRPVEPFHEPVGPRAADPRRAVLDVVQRQVQFVGVALGAAELAAVVGQDRLHLQAPTSVLRQDVVMEDQRGMLRHLRRVQVPEGVGAIGVHHGLEVHLADALERAT